LKERKLNLMERAVIAKEMKAHAQSRIADILDKK
jgi:hypothetical protein